MYPYGFRFPNSPYAVFHGSGSTFVMTGQEASADLVSHISTESASQKIRREILGDDHEAARNVDSSSDKSE